MKTLTCLFLLVIARNSVSQSMRFYVVKHWKYINFTWPDEDALKTATAQGLYVPENIIVSGVKYYDDYFYLTLPRMKSGVPVTLSRIKAGPGQGVSPNLEPFPSWEMNSLEDCNNLQNVQNVEIDARGIMWIIDGGRVQTLTNPVVKCSPKLVIYDLTGRRVSTVYQFPEEVAARNGSYLYDLVVDNTDGGYAYITDNGPADPGIIVYSVRENRSWKVRDPKTMSADPTATRLIVNNSTIDSPINIAGIALGPKIHHASSKVVINEDREVYYSPLSSLHLYSVNTSVLRDENLSKSTNLEGSIKDVGEKESQSVGMVMDNQGILYYNLLGLDAVAKWDSHTPFQSGQKVIARDKTYLEWPNSFTFDGRGNLTILMNRLNRFIFNKVDLNQYNFNLISAHVGARSYVYDEQFSYEASTTAEPIPKAEPAHDHDHSSEHNNDHNVSSTTNSSKDNVIITKGSGTKLVVSLLMVGLGSLIALV